MGLSAQELEKLRVDAGFDPEAAEVLADFYEETERPSSAKVYRDNALFLRAQQSRNKPPSIRIERVPLDRSGYNHAGKYFGIGAPVFDVFGQIPEKRLLKDDTFYFLFNLRAKDRRDAITKVELKYPEAKIRGGSLKRRGKSYKPRRLY